MQPGKENKRAFLPGYMCLKYYCKYHCCTYLHMQQGGILWIDVAVGGKVHTFLLHTCIQPTILFCYFFFLIYFYECTCAVPIRLQEHTAGLSHVFDFYSLSCLSLGAYLVGMRPRRARNVGRPKQSRSRSLEAQSKLKTYWETSYCTTSITGMGNGWEALFLGVHTLKTALIYLSLVKHRLRPFYLDSHSGRACHIPLPHIPSQS